MITEDIERQVMCSQIERFCSKHAKLQRPLALVTSGGTCADLELNSVRCLDNFSTGLRGALSVEAFLSKGYAVIHLQRRGSVSPFACRLCQRLGYLTGSLNVEAFARLMSKNRSDDAHIDEKISNDSMVVSSLRRLRKTLDDDLLLTVTFRSVEDYLQRLEDCCKSMSSPYEERGSMKLCVVYLAAAVSDFYIPKEERCLHKIQSRSTVGSTGSPGLSLELKPVPKLLRKVVDEWCRESFVISFKLETDESILFSKSHAAISTYGVHLVVANELHSRNKRVWIINKGSLDSFESKMIEKNEGMDLEEFIIDYITEKHFEYIADGTPILASTTSLNLAQTKSERLGSTLWGLLENKYFLKAMEISGPVIGAIISYYISSLIAKKKI
mmetsp:Transcript_5384/g.7261  ORF Transcript_5384/g.7261 Transcript_5384/m.7261 type:complete len:385 (+) Transcript_5384:103-1257(+)